MPDIYKWDTTAANNATADPDIDWQEGQSPRTVNDSARQMMAGLAHFRNDLASALTTGGTGNAYTVTPTSQPSSLANGWVGLVRFDRANTGAATMQVGGLPATPADLVDAEGNALPSDFIAANGIYLVAYNPTTAKFHIISKNYNSVIGPASATDGNIAIFDGTTGKLLKDTGNTIASITVSGTSPRVNLTETDTGAYGRVQLTNGKLKLQVTNADGTANAGGTIQLSGYAGADIAKLEVIKNGALKEIWDDDNFAARIAALTQNTAPAGTESVACDDGQRVTLENIVAVAQSVAANGYVKLPNGLIIQWGETVPVAYTATENITFPVSYASACYSVVITPNGQTSTSAQAQDYVSSVTTTGFSVTHGGTLTVTFYWVAIGV